MCKNKNCRCATCVHNANIYENTPIPCIRADCGICEDEDMEVCFCNQHLTIGEVDRMVDLIKKGLTYEEARVIIKA